MEKKINLENRNNRFLKTLQRNKLCRDKLKKISTKIWMSIINPLYIPPNFFQFRLKPNTLEYLIRNELNIRKTLK